MTKKLTTALVAAAAAATVALPATPAAADMRDCRILGPAYVEEVKDCVLYIYETAIGW